MKKISKESYFMNFLISMSFPIPHIWRRSPADSRSLALRPGTLRLSRKSLERFSSVSLIALWNGEFAISALLKIWLARKSVLRNCIDIEFSLSLSICYVDFFNFFQRFFSFPWASNQEILFLFNFLFLCLKLSLFVQWLKESNQFAKISIKTIQNSLKIVFEILINTWD